MTKPKDRPSRRLYWPTSLLLGQPLTLTAEQCHYLFKVMRMRDGDRVGLFNQTDGEFSADLHQTGKKSGTALPTKQILPPLGPMVGPSVHLFMAPIKRQQTELVVQKATELGVDHITLVSTQHAKGDTVKMDRLNSIAIEACEQSERLAPPQINGPIPLNALLNPHQPLGYPLLVCAEAGDTQPLVSALQSLTNALSPTPSRIGILVGPEGGFSAAELDGLQALKDAHMCGLGPRILKAETAAIAAISVVQALAGDAEQQPSFRA